MGLTRQLFKTLFIWLGIIIIIILAVLFPRTAEINADVLLQYKENIAQFIHGIVENKSLGNTRFNEPVEEDIKRYMSRSLILILFAFAISIPAGILKGIYDYRRTYAKNQFFGHGFTWFMQSLPDFFIVISVQWMLILLMRMGFPNIPIYGYDEWYNVFTPSIMLAIFPTMYIARITSSALAGQEGKQYIQTAHAKGIPQHWVVYRHALANCWGIILSHFSSLMLYILSNLLIVEYLMFYKGAAYRFYEALGYHSGIINFVPLNKFEAELIIGLSVSFMMLVLFAQIVSQVAKYYLDPNWRDEV